MLRRTQIERVFHFDSMTIPPLWQLTPEGAMDQSPTLCNGILNYIFQNIY